MSEGRNLLEVVLNTNIAKKFNEVDNSVASLQERFVSATTAANNFASAIQNVTNSLNASSTGDFAAKISQLVDSMTRLNSAGNNSAGLTAMQEGIQNIGISATQNVDMINRLIEAINKLPEAFSRTSTKIKTEETGGKDILDSLLYDTSGLEKKKAEFQALIDDLQNRIKTISLKEINAGLDTISFDNLFRMTKQVIDEFEATSGKKIDNIKNKLIELAQLYEQKASSGTLFDTNIIDEYETLRTILVSLKEEYQNMLKAAENYKNQSMDSNALQQGYKVQLETLDRSLKSLEKDFEEIGKEIEEFSSRNEKIKNSVRQIEEYKEKIKELDKEFERLKRSKLAFDEDGKLTKEARDLLEDKKGYEEQIKLYQISADEAIKQEQRKVEEEKKLEKEKFEEIKKLYSERLELEKKSATIETSRKVKEMSGVDTTKETELLAKYNQRIEELKNKILELQIEYQDLHQEAKKTYDIKSLEVQINEEDKRRNAIDRTTKQIERLTAAEAREAQQDLGTTRKPQTVEEYRIAIKNLQQQIEKMPVGDKTGIAQLNEKIKQYQKELDEAVPKTQRFRQENEKLGSVMRQVASAFGIYIGLQSITNLARNVAKTTGEFELQHRALQAIIGDMQSANQLWDKTIRLAVRSPYNVKQLVTYTKQLSAYRIETNKLYDTTKMLADISAGLGVDMQRLILAYGQVKAANYLRGQELRQFSEAGINILGELAKYFTELKGQAISTGDVFEMVSKRMVKFEDVAEVLKRMTEEGGDFYQMQEIQAETLSGMYANLKDRIDIMLNSIGTETRGVFVNIIKFATFLIEHWQSLSNMLTAGLIVWAAYKAEVWRAASAKGAFTANTIAATAAEGGFIGMLAKSKIALKSFAASIKTIFTTGLGWVGIALAAITTIINVIIQHNRKIDEAKQKYEELNKGINKNGITGFNELSKSIEKNNEKIRENNRLIEEAREAGDKEGELRLQNEINNLQKKNSEIVEDIRDKYSELSDEIITTSEGIVEIGAGTKELAHIQTMTTDFTNLFGENAGRQNDIIETTKELELAFKSLDLATSQFNTQYTYWINNVERELKESTKLSDDFKEGVQSIIDDETLSNLQKYSAIQSKVESRFGGMRKVLGSIDRDYVVAMVSAQSRIDNLSSSVSNEIGRVTDKIREMYDVAGDKKTAEKASEEFIKNLGFIKGAVSDFLTRMFSEKLDISVNITPSDDKKSLQTWQQNINKFIDKTRGDDNGELTIPISAKITDEQQTQEAYAKFVKGLVDDAQKIIDIWTKIGDETKQDVVTQQQYNNAVAQLPHLQELSRRAGNLDKNKNGKSNPALELLNKQIDAIKRANTEYKKYQELFDNTTAFNKTKEDFKDLFDELNLTPYINSISSFSDAVVKEAFESKYLKKFVTSAGKQGEIAGAKFRSGFQYEIDKLSFDEALDNANKEITKIFDQYDFGKELEKLGISKDMGKALFNVDSLDFDGMRKALQEIKNEVFDRQGDDEDFDGKKVKEWVEKQEAKITELENKAQKERLESYINYMRQAMNQRAQIIYDGIKETADIEMTFQKEIEKARSAGDEKRVAELEALMNRAMQGSKENTEKKLQNQAFEDFKGGELYIRMFEDLDNTSTMVLETMRKRLIEIKESMHELSPTELKAINSEIEKINNQLAQRSSFANLKESLEEAFAVVEKETGKTSTLSKLGDLFITGKTERKIGTEISNNENEIAEQEALLAAIQAVLQAKENGNEVTLESVGISQEYARYLSMDVNALRQEEATEKANLKTKKDTQRELLNEEATLKKLRNSIKQHANQWKNTTSSIKSLISTVVENIELFGGETNHTTEAWGDLLGAIMDVLGMLPIYVASMAAAGTAVNASLGIIGLIAEAVQLVITLVAALVKMDDAAAQDQIDGIQNSVNRLSDAYDRLKDKFDEAWDVNKLKEYRDALEANIKKQMSDYDAMIAVEKTRKNPDEEQIYEWQQAKLDLQKDYEDVIEDFKKEMGGIGASGFKDAAQEFVDAWADAFIETGDGMEGLMEHFDEVLLNLVKKQAMQRVASRYLDGIFKMIDDAIGDNGTISTEQIEAIRQEFEQTVPQLSQSLKALFESLGIFGGEAENQLSGLEKGIQGVTEETAEIIAAYLNSIRFYIIDTNTKIGQLIAAIQDTTGMSNPMLQELRNIKQKTEEIRDFLYQRQEYGDNSLRVFVTNP